MDVHLYVYDLSQGMARQMSLQFLGIHIDAVYHTSLVFGNVEYSFGAGVQQTRPGTTHHGRPMEIISLGKTTLPQDMITEYLGSLMEIYTAESYDLFAHNCNNFTNDFAMFLVGRGIPSHITSLPQTVLNTPFGQMLRPQIDRAMRPIVQAPIPPRAIVPGLTRETSLSSASTGTSGKVHGVNSPGQLDILLADARASCAVIFFTSATCAPCRTIYSLYDDLATEFRGKAMFIKVDIGQIPTIASSYSIKATPTFITFLKGSKQDVWTDGNPNQLRTMVQMLVHTAFPTHPHELLKLPNLRRTNNQPVLYSKLPPFEKLTAKLGDTAKAPTMKAAISFVQIRNAQGAQEAPLPDLAGFGSFLLAHLSEIAPEVQFAAYDLLRLMLIDKRVSGFFAQPANLHTITKLIQHVNILESRMYSLHLVSIHLCCNLFTTPLLADSALSNSPFVDALVTLITSSLLIPDRANLRTAAASLAYNICGAQQGLRAENGSHASTTAALPDSAQLELAASLLEALTLETESQEAVRGLIISLARLVYCAPMDGEVLELCRAMDAKSVVEKKLGFVKKQDEAIVREVVSLLGEH